MNELITGRARPVLLPVSEWGEVLAIAIIGISDRGEPFARVCSTRIPKCLSDEVSHACHSFGSLVAQDFLAWCQKNKDSEAWAPPIGGLQLGAWLELDAFDVTQLAEIALNMSVLYVARDPQVADELKQQMAPRSREESRFLDSVKTFVVGKKPSLAKGFRKHFSLTGKDVGGEIDFLGSRYATCYAAINPRTKQVLRIQTASAALWRLARARDEFGFAAPEAVELTAWVPPEGLPIYSDRDYSIVRETVAELSEQAKREQLGVFTVTDSGSASEHLMKAESGNRALDS